MSIRLPTPQVVIVVEGTRGIDFLFGVIIAVVCSNWIAQIVNTDGVYESELERDTSVYFLRQEPPHALREHTAAMVRSQNLHLTPSVCILPHRFMRCGSAQPPLCGPQTPDPTIPVYILC